MNKDDFSPELCEAFVTANIPFHTLSNLKLRKFLETCMQRNIPDKSTLRNDYFYETYEDVLRRIRMDILKSSIYASIDVLTHKEVRKIILFVSLGLLCPLHSFYFLVDSI